MAKEVAIVVSGDAYSLPEEMVKEYGLNVLPYPLTLEGKHYMIPDTISAEGFLEEVKKAKGFPITAAVNTARFVEVYKRLTDEGKAIVTITMAGGIFSQPSIDAAKKAIEEVPGAEVSVVNSMLTVAGMGLPVLEAARAAKEGKDREDVAKTAQEVASRTTLILALPNLEYLHRGGRIGKAKALLGSLMKVIPIAILKYGTQVIGPLGKGRNIQQVNQKIIATIKSDMEKSGAKKIKALIADVGDNPEATKNLKEALEKNIDCEELIIGKIRAGIVHVGPSGWNIGYYLVK
jgi:DegV family protein with EDD domain